jgi:transposase
MHLKPHRKRVNGEIYEYWSLVKSVRTPRGPRHRTVAFIGKEPGLERKTRVGWEHIAAILDGRARQADFLEGPAPDPPQWANVDASRVSVERLRDFGAPYLGLALWRRLGLERFFDEAVEPGREEIAWPVMAAILTLARFCAPSSELQAAEFWYGKTALDDLLGVAVEKVNDDRLYRSLDALLPHKDALFAHLRKTYGELFGTTFDILLYDITSTYFEGQMKANPQARRGYSRDKRPDCLQVCIGLVVTPEGLPLAYEIFDGNRVDVTTVEEIIATMRQKYGHERRTWVMDRGMVSEENLEQLRGWKAKYLVGTPKATLRQFERELLGGNWTQMENGVEVKLAAAPDGSKETYVLCRSPGRIEKERAMRRRQVDKMEAELAKLKRACERISRPLRQLGAAERRVGRIMQRWPGAARLFDVAVDARPDPADPKKTRLRVEIARRDERAEWAELADGCYLLRTNLEETDPARLWEIYIGLTQVEFSFRVTKSDLSIRPIYHRLEERTQAHILVCFLALVLWRTLEQWMKASGLGTCPRKLLQEMAEVRSMDVILPTKAGRDLRLRAVGRPEKRLALLLDRLGLPLPNRPKRIPNVVPKTTLRRA